MFLPSTLPDSPIERHRPDPLLFVEVTDGAGGVEVLGGGGTEVEDPGTQPF